MRVEGEAGERREDEESRQLVPSETRQEDEMLKCVHVFATGEFD